MTEATETSRKPLWLEHGTDSPIAATQVENLGASIRNPPVRLRDFVALLLLVALSDLTIYRSSGFAGPSVLFLVAPLLIWLGLPRHSADRSVYVIAPLLLLTSIRLMWCGSILAVCTGVVLFGFMAMSLAGIKPYVVHALTYVMFLLQAAVRGLARYGAAFSRFRFGFSTAQWFAVLAPTIAVIGFATIFIKANPDLAKSVGRAISDFFEHLQWWTEGFDFGEFVFCLAAGFVACGILNPLIQHWLAANYATNLSRQAATAPHFAAYRNTLISVIVLFAAYLIFEFQSLWFRSFPKGFHYSGYAHEGAAWLTVALAIATVMLSVTFHGDIRQHVRVRQLKTLAWIWSVENLLLGIAVFHRLWIYVRFNGMTQMRVVGLLGVASVIGGFLLVVVKINRNHNFTWLIRRQLWTVMFAIYLYAVLPVDAFVNHYNVNRIRAGDLAPSVQIAFHPTSDEGLLFLSPLIDCPDDAVRNGIRAMLGVRLSELMNTTDHILPDWTRTQVAHIRLKKQLKPLQDKLLAASTAEREIAKQKFRDYSYQWY